jgi:hypothetical protein
MGRTIWRSAESASYSWSDSSAALWAEPAGVPLNSWLKSYRPASLLQRIILERPSPFVWEPDVAAKYTVEQNSENLPVFKKAPQVLTAVLMNCIIKFDVSSKQPVYISFKIAQMSVFQSKS